MFGYKCLLQERRREEVKAEFNKVVKACEEQKVPHVLLGSR